MNQDGRGVQHKIPNIGRRARGKEPLDTALSPRKRAGRGETGPGTRAEQLSSNSVYSQVPAMKDLLPLDMRNRLMRARWKRCQDGGTPINRLKRGAIDSKWIKAQ